MSGAWREQRFLSFDQTPIFYRRLAPSGPPKAFLVILHGMGEHGGRYQRFAEYLAEIGIESFVPDLRGFGRSGGRRGFVRRFSDFHRDLDAVLDLKAKQSPEEPLFLMGHSFGGLLSSSYLASHPKRGVRGLVLSSPLFGIALRVPFWGHLAGMAASWFLPHYTQDNRVDILALTHDREILLEYQKDKQVHHRISARLYAELRRTMDRSGRIAGLIRQPALVLQAGEDRIVSKEATLRFFDALSSQDKELEVYEGLYHEILNETDRQRVFSRIGLWILSHLND